MTKPVISAAIVLLTLLTFFQFPGHTWLQSDTQIYAPILEHMRDPSVLGKDILVARPHVAFTLYDETAVDWARLTGLGFERILAGEQIVLRGLGTWGVYLLAAALGLAPAPALLVTMAFSLGATIMGPAVLSIEYEPVPRGFAVPLLMLAVGLMAQGRRVAAGIAGAGAFLFHAPTCLPFWAVCFVWVLWPGEDRVQRARVFVPLVIAAILLWIFSRSQTASSEPQEFFARVEPWLEALQRVRGSYNWISVWWRQWLLHYVLLWIATVVACWRLRAGMTRDQRFFLAGIPLYGILSVPASYLFLEQLKWSLMPQVQPMRALLFVAAFAVILGAVAGCHAARNGRWLEALLWFLLVYLVPANRVVTFPSASRTALIACLAGCSIGALWLHERRGVGWQAAMAAAALLPFFLIPTWGSVRNYPTFEHPALAEVAQWARAATQKDDVFLFPDSAEDLRPGVFREEALRAVYVDWKGGGQINFLKQLGAEWWSRWQRVMAGGFDPQHLERYRGPGIDYLVIQRKNRLASPPPAFENTAFSVYAVSALTP
jgi:hypothetical protein